MGSSLVTLVLMLTAARILAGFSGFIRGLYSGGSGKGPRGGDDFSEIEAMLIKGDYAGAIMMYKDEYEKRGCIDERPRIRIGEIYRLKLKNYIAAINQFAAIARATDNPDIKLDMFTRMLEIFRDHIPDHPGFDHISAIVLKRYPGTLASKIAEQHISLKGG